MPFCTNRPARPWGRLCFCSAQEPAPSWGRRAGVPVLGRIAAAQLFLRQSTSVFDSSLPAKARLSPPLPPGVEGGSAALDLPLPRATHPPASEASISVGIVFSLLCWLGRPPAASMKLSCVYAACRPPQHPGFQGKRLLQLTSLGRRKQACRLWCLSTNLSPTSLSAGPQLLLCMESFFPMAAPAGLRPDIGITCFGSSHWHYSQGCQHTSLLPSFSDAKVFSLIDVFFPGRLIEANTPLTARDKGFTCQVKDWFPATFRKTPGLHFVFQPNQHT